MDTLTSAVVGDLVPLLVPVFGGCCANVFVLETILSSTKSEEKLGLIITFCQFALTATISYLENADFKNGSIKTLWIKGHHVPLVKFWYSVVMFFTVLVLNNLVYRFDISVPLYTIIRSSSSVITMILGYLVSGKRYSRHQVFSAILISLGIIVITLPRDAIVKVGPSGSRFALGVTILMFSSVVGAFIGIYNESLVKQYGNHWKESLFYTHLLGLPLFLFTYPILRKEYHIVMASPPSVLGIPQQVVNLAINLATQLICIRGVNKLALHTSSLSVTVVLLVRKVLSLLISMWWYGNRMQPKEATGAVMVLVGTVYYSLSNMRKGKKDPKKEE